jgi:hypothetical protein
MTDKTAVAKTPKKRPPAKKKTAEVAVLDPQANALQIIANAASNPEVDIDKFSTIMEWQQKLEDKAAKQEYAAAMSLCQSQMPLIQKKRYNEQTKSWYEDIDAVLDTCVPIYTKHGFSLGFKYYPSELENHKRVEVTVMHSGGHSELFTDDVPLDGLSLTGKSIMTKTHANASTKSYTRRYMMKDIFNLRTSEYAEDDDGQAAGAAEDGVIEGDFIEAVQELPPWTDELMKEYLPQFKKAVAAQRRSTEDCITWIEASYTLNEKQKDQIRAIAQELINENV